MYIFISHSSTDATIAKDICNALEASGSQCFLAPRDIRSGHEYASEILNGLDNCDVFLLLLSDRANQSPHVLREVERAVSNSTPIIVYKLEDVELTKSMEYFLMTHQWLNAKTGDYANLLSGIEEFKKAKGEASNTAFAPSVQTPVTPTITPQAPNKQKSSSKSFIPWIIVSCVITALVVIILVLLINDSNDDIAPSTAPTTLEANNTTSNTTKQTEQSSTSVNTEEDATDDTTNQNVDTSAINVELGDTIIMGNYNDEDIEWSIINISEDGSQAVVLAKNILTFKAFTGAESGKFGRDDDGKLYLSTDEEMTSNLELQAYVRGSNIWADSDIRTWLNSDTEYVEYDGHGPISGAMADIKNAYNLEAGFLCSFTDEELAAIKETTVKTKGNELSKEDTVTSTDRVFLLSKDELKWIEDAKIALFTSPTEGAIEGNESYFYDEYCIDVFGTKACLWWLREPLEGSVSECYLISHGAKPDRDFENAIVAVEDFGIRPAMTIDLTSDAIKLK